MNENIVGSESKPMDFRHFGVFAEGWIITMIENRVNKICKTMKMSKYNFIVNDDNDNLVIYNFLVGLPSLTKIMKTDKDIFRKLFIGKSVIHGSDCEKYKEIVTRLMEVGILVDSDIDEGVLYDAKSYEEIYDNKLYLTILPTGRCVLTAWKLNRTLRVKK